MKEKKSSIEIPVRRYRTRLRTGRSVKEFAYDAIFIKGGCGLKNHCILFLTGTSTQLEDVDYFIRRLINKGYSVASIERSIGSPFHIMMKPKNERVAALRHFIDDLRGTEEIQTVDIIAHSYASLEVIRLLIEEPGQYVNCIRHIIFLNPAGFNDNIKYIPHCFRFSFIFVMKEYIRSTLHLVPVRKRKTDNGLNEFYWNKLCAIHSLFLKTIQNPVRTFKEVADIVSFKLPSHVELLIKRYGYNFYFFLNTEDELVMASKAIDHVKRLVPEKRILTFPGNHLDILINQRQIKALLDYLHNIMVTA